MTIAFLQNMTKEKEAMSVPYHVWILTIQTIGLTIKGKYKSQRRFEGLAFTVFENFNHESTAILFFCEYGLNPFYWSCSTLTGKKLNGFVIEKVWAKQ